MDNLRGDVALINCTHTPTAHPMTGRSRLWLSKNMPKKVGLSISAFLL